jgi:hypothetical protein
VLFALARGWEGEHGAEIEDDLQDDIEERCAYAETAADIFVRICGEKSFEYLQCLDLLQSLYA